MKRAAALGVLLLALASCGDDEPDIDWSQVPSNQRALIGDAVDDGDCEAMQTYFDGTEDGDLLAYLDWHMKDAGCY